MVKQEMARLNIYILGISELKWTGELNAKQVNLIPMTIISTTVGKNPVEEMVQPTQSTKQSEMHQLGDNLKNSRMISVRFQNKPFIITVIQLYAPITGVEAAEVDDSMKTYTTFQNTHTHIQMSFVSIADWNAKEGSQEVPRITCESGLRVKNQAG